MKAIICSYDGVPRAVAVVNDYADVEALREQLRRTRAYDRIDVVEVVDDLLADAGTHGNRSLPRCPECWEPLTAGDRTNGRCPSCGAQLTAEPWQVAHTPDDEEPDTSKPHVPGCPRLFLASAECLCNPPRTALREDA